MTAREAAKDLIRGYVERGDSRESLADGCLGYAGSDYYASIGGYIWNGSHTDGTARLVRKVGRYQIGVELFLTLWKGLILTLSEFACLDRSSIW